MGCGNSNTTITKDVTRHYCYTSEEIEEIKTITTNKTKDLLEFKDEEIIFDKFTTEINDSNEIIVKEYISIYTHKNAYPFSGTYKFVSPKLELFYEINLIDVKINNNKINDYKCKFEKEKFTKKFIVDIPYTINKNDNPYLTFEVSYSYSYLYCYIYIKIPFEYEKENPFTFTITSNKFHYNQIFGKFNGKNILQNFSNKIILIGKEKQNNLIFLLMDNNGIFLDKFINCYAGAFYYLNENEKRNIEKGINSCKLSESGLNIVSLRNEIIINGNKVNYKTYLTDFNLADHKIYSNQLITYFFKPFPDLKILTFKIFNKEEKYKIKEMKDINYIYIKFRHPPGQYFNTLELELSFTFDFADKDYVCIPLKDHFLLEGCYYQLYIKNLNKNYSINFYRNDINIESNEKYDYIIRTFYKKYNDDKDFNYLYINK